jgi:hypothetical protein
MERWVVGMAREGNEFTLREEVPTGANLYVMIRDGT